MAAVIGSRGWYDRKRRRVRDLSCGGSASTGLRCAGVACRSCGKVKRERLAFLADNPFYTKRFAWLVGRRCRRRTIRDVAEELQLDWHTVKELDKQYMGEQISVAGRRAQGDRHR